MSKNSAAPLRVAKFGGTSVADFDAMNHSADIILANPAVRLVVLSASAGVTNVLVALSEGNKAERRAYYLNEIRRIQYSIIDRLVEQKVIREEIDRMLDNVAMLAEAAGFASSLALTDELVSHGELMSTLLFVEVLRQRGMAAVAWFDVRKVMRTNDQFGRAAPDSYMLKVQTRTLLLPRLESELIITQGFIGSEARGRTTTLGRSGSDYTAALLGEALEAGRIDIWTDVPGIYTSDPHVVPQAKRIDEISFEEAAEMATYGAKILHPATLLPAVRSAIPVFVGSSKDPGAGGTLVYNHIDKPPLRALALRRSQTLLILHSLNILHAMGFLAEVFNILARHTISVDLLTTSGVSMALAMDTTGSTTTGESLLTQALLTELSSLCRVEVEQNLALVTLIGNKLPQVHGVEKEVFSVLDPFNIRLICYGASNHNLCLLVPGDDAEQVVRTLHGALFSSATG